MDRFAATDFASRAEQALAPAVASAGFGLLMCEWTGGSPRPVLWVYIERPDGSYVDIADCVKVHEAITDLLDVEDFIPAAYDLRVSSPGLERPLKRIEHFAAVLGQAVRIRTWEPIGDRRNWKGVLRAVQDDIVTVEVDGQEHRIPLPAVERANLVWEPEAAQPRRVNTRKKRNRR